MPLQEYDDRFNAYVAETYGYWMDPGLDRWLAGLQKWQAENIALRFWQGNECSRLLTR